MKTYADLLQLVASSSVLIVPGGQQHPRGGGSRLPAPSTNGHAGKSDTNYTSGDTRPAAAPQLIEAADDPHRLARVNLARYADLSGGMAALKYWRGEWYTWKGRAYRKIEERELKAKIAASVKAEFDRLAAEKMADNPDADDVEIEVRKVTPHLVKAVLDATASLPGVLVSGHVDMMTWLGESAREQRRYIACRNGILDLERLLADQDDVLLEHSPRWFSTVCLPYEFQEGADCPRWKEFLEFNLEGDRERIHVLQEWAGYLLFPDSGQQKFLVLEGEGANGKSVYMAAITAMLGVENCSHVSLEVFGDRFSRSQTLGKLVNVAADVGEMDKPAEGYLKSFVSGDVMFFDRKGIPGLDCAPTARMMMACNNRPRFSDRSAGIWRRMLLVPWRIEVPEGRRVANMDKPWWWERSGELPGILLWAIRGLARLRAQGRFTTSDVSTQAMADYKAEVNPAAAFLGEFTEEGPGSEIRCSTLYAAYAHWTASNGYRALGERQFGKEVSRKYREVKHKRRGSRQERFWVYEGIGFSVEEILGRKFHNENF